MGIVDEKTVKRVFGEYSDLITSEDVVRECVQLCNTFAKTPEDLVFKWQSICFNMRTTAVSGSLQALDGAGVALLKQELQKEVQQVAQAKKASTVNARRGQARPQPRQSMPQATRQPLSTAPKNQAIKIHDSMKDRHYRYMHEKLAERATVLDDKIDEFAEIVREYYHLEDIGDPASTSDEEVVIVGRVCCDDDTKLNEASLVIETSRLMGAGARVRLRMNPEVTTNGKSSQCLLYPGAIVALKGRNETGEWFQVSSVLMLPNLPSNPDSARQERPLSMKMAAGPFTPDSDLSYQPFITFLDQVRLSPPSWLLLFGPFIDSNHSKIRTGDVEAGPADLFQTRILSPLRSLLREHPGITVLIIPSVNDLIASHAAFPQPPFSLAQSLQSERVVFLPNPCTFTIDHIKFAAASVDVFFHLQSQLLRKKVTPEDGFLSKPDPMTTLSASILEQRSLYPLFPSANPAEVNLDVSHSEMLSLDEVLPDVLILPSRLKQFQKNVGDTVVINPCLASKGVHATLFIQDARSLSTATNGSGSSVVNRASVELHSSQTGPLTSDFA